MAALDIPHPVEPDLNARLAGKEREDNLTVQNVNFLPNPEDNVRLLANTAYASNPEQAAKYEAKIMASIQNYLRPEYNIQGFWHDMAEQGCNLIEIVEGVLKFFKQEPINGVLQKTEIPTRKYLDIKIPASTSVDRVDATMKAEVLTNTQNSLAALLAEIQGKKAA